MEIIQKDIVVMAKEWDFESNTYLLPTMFTRSSNKKVNWICRQGHRWEASIDSRTRGRGCLMCNIDQKSKSVKCVKTGKIYKSITDAQEQTGICHIGEVCLEKRKTAGGYHWEYYP